MRCGTRLTLFRVASLIALICYAVFLSIDFGDLGQTKLSLAAKYAGLLCCVFCSLLSGSRLLFFTLALTAVCDYFLLYTKSFATGVSLFFFVQILHTVRFIKMNRIDAKWLFLPFCLSFIGVVVAESLFGEPVLTAAFAYAPALLCAWAFALLAFLRAKKKRPEFLYSTFAMTLFVACDVCVALFNAGLNAAADWIWLFYLPSQWLLTRGTTEASGGKLF